MTKEALQFYSTLFAEDSQPTIEEENLILSCIASFISEEENLILSSNFDVRT